MGAWLHEAVGVEHEEVTGVAQAHANAVRPRRRGGLLVALAAGTATIAFAERADLRHDPFRRPGTALAARLGAEFAGFPGGRLAPMELPAPFAAGLCDAFGRL
jgi:hypothetical protein